ncbi:MAG: class I SAM-dependent RNA methyltransferase [Paludibacteraceae bacterium]|nr:class I SAM-dependent RNA methyltransferase [Paludibacteraceae bacterium]
MKEFKMIAKTFKGLEEVLAGELVELGANNVQLERRAVSFIGDKRLLYRANLCLRTASRVLVPITTFKAGDADAVYEQVKQIDWAQYMTLQTGFQIDATVYSDTFRHSRYVTYRVKDAIVDWWNEKEGKRPNVKLSNPDLSLNIHIANETVTLSLDSSGESLHKRGYRVANTEAPINEALAAGMLLMAGWKGETDFYDLMCGSGTLLIEAALIAQNIAPGIFRKGFAFEKWADFDKELFEDIYNDDSAERPFTHHIYGSDASFYAVQQALKNVKSAGQQRTIEVRQIRLQEIKRDNQTPALIMVNPPYGERLAQDKDVMRLYADMGTAFKHQFTGSTAWVISSNEDALKCIGLKPSKRIKLLNGELECWFNQYELFAGERKTFVANKTPKKANHGRTTHK